MDQLVLKTTEQYCLWYDPNSKLIHIRFLTHGTTLDFDQEEFGLFLHFLDMCKKSNTSISEDVKESLK